VLSVDHVVIQLLYDDLLLHVVVVAVCHILDMLLQCFIK
jgi:hypothetical protein